MIHFYKQKLWDSCVDLRKCENPERDGDIERWEKAGVAAVIHFADETMTIPFKDMISRRKKISGGHRSKKYKYADGSSEVDELWMYEWLAD